MTDRRSGPPLFDLMRERERERNPGAPARPQDQKAAGKPNPGAEPKPSAQPATDPSAPTQVNTQAKPNPGAAPAQDSRGPAASQTPARQTAWDSSGGVSRAERSAAAMLDDTPNTDTGIQMSTTRFYTMVAIALMLIVGAWAGGYQIGKEDGKDEMSQFVSDPPVVSPQQPGGSPAAQPTAQPTGQTANRDTAANPSRNQNQTPSQPQGSATGIITATGFTARDPRQPGMNYLVLATLPADQATDAVGFMNAAGVPVIAVPQLDSRGSGANNPSRYTLYSLGLAIPGNRWSSMSTQRSEHQQAVANLGARWQRDHRGGSDFSQTNWEKYEP